MLLIIIEDSSAWTIGEFFSYYTLLAFISSITEDLMQISGDSEQ